MAFSAEQIQAIRERVDIVKVIGSYVQLKKRGQRYLGLCPFHGEKTPSFSVSAQKNLYYCFGCHAGGDVFSFLMRHQGLDFGAAARRLAAEVGIELEPESPAEKQRRQAHEELQRVNQYAQAFFSHALWAEGGKPARTYLNQRGLSEEFARTRQLGYGGEPGALLAYLGAKKVPGPLAGRAGLLSDDGQRALFDGRLIFPIVDTHGRLAGFGGRRLGEGLGAKYINTRESELFSKRRLLYGWEVAQEAIRRRARVIIVEGYLDVLACERAGLDEAVAALGTAFTDEHAETVARLAKEAVVLFDSDVPGQVASRHAVERLIGAKLKTLVALLPAGEDPDSLVRQRGAEALTAVVSAARPAVEHFLEQAFDKPAPSIEERAAAARELASLFAALPSGLERDLYTARLADKVGVSVEQLNVHLKAAAPKRRDSQRPSTTNAPVDLATTSAAPTPKAPTLDRFEQNLLRDLLLYPELRPRLGELAEFADDLMRVLLEALATSEQPATELLATHLSDARLLGSIRQVHPAQASGEPDLAARAEQTFADALGRLKSRHMRANRREMLRELQEAEARGEDTDELVRRIQNLTRRERELKRPRSTPSGST